MDSGHGVAGAAKKRSLAARFLRSTLGLKVVMAVTGAVLVLFLLGHVAGNLLAFSGRAKLNAYAAFLHSNPMSVWVVRAALLLCAAIHVAAATRLVLLSLDARPASYRMKGPRASTYAARTMIWSGPLIALFVIFHLLHLTVGSVHPDFRTLDVYHNVVAGLGPWPVAAVYALAMLGLAFHLSHGVWSLCQTVGVNHPRWDRPLRALAVAFAILLACGFVAIPVAVLCGVIS